METLNQYRQFIQQVLTEHNQFKPSSGNLEQFTIFDTRNDHYQLTTVGWDGAVCLAA
ncbi:MAG: element excision factor XisI family protein [Cyanobacteria bacterium J06592_8]